MGLDLKKLLRLLAEAVAAGMLLPQLVRRSFAVFLCVKLSEPHIVNCVLMNYIHPALGLSLAKVKREQLSSSSLSG